MLEPSILFNIGSFPITNTLVTTLIVDLIIVALVVAFNVSMSLYPKSVQNVLEMVYEYFYNSTKDVSDRVKVIYPWVITFFLFIVIANLLGQFPGFESIRFITAKGENVPLFRTATSDLNVTLAFAVISIFMCHFYSIKYTGVKSYISRFITFKMFPIFMFVGFLEFIGEFTKVISLSCRLFGNLFAGESVMSTVSGMCAFGLPLPFMCLELMVAVIQAIVFAMLTMAFMSIMTEKH